MTPVEIISVNYNTPDFIERMVDSVQKEGNYPIRIIDGSDREPYENLIRKVCKRYGVTLQQQGWNIHHGRGMDLGVSTSEFKYVLLIDSDNYLRSPIIEKMHTAMTQNDRKIVGWYCYCNDKGYGNGRRPDHNHPIKYWHPSLMMIETEFYRELKSKGITFVHHGAPCIEIMKYLHKKGLSDIGLDILEYLKSFV